MRLLIVKVTAAVLLRGWRAGHGREYPEDQPETFVFCPECWEREFGVGRRDEILSRFRNWPPESRDGVTVSGRSVTRPVTR